MGDRDLIVMPEERAVAVPSSGIKMLGGLEEYTPAQLGLRPNELRINHSKKKKTDPEPGTFKLGLEILDQLRVVFIRVHPIRTLKEGSGKDARRVCASGDGWRPHEWVPEPRSPVCMKPTGMRPKAVCPFAKWDTDPATEKKTRPACNAGHALMGLRLDRQDGKLQPFWFACASTSGAIAAEQFLGELFQASERDGAQGIWEYEITLKLQERTQGDGGFVYYAPLFLAVRFEQPSRYEDHAFGAREYRYIPEIFGTDDEDDEPAPSPAAASNGTEKPPVIVDSDVPF